MEGERKIIITLSVPTFVGSVLILCAGFACLFFLGVLLGRGYTPEAGIPLLERFMPHSTSVHEAPLILATDAPSLVSRQNGTTRSALEDDKNTTAGTSRVMGQEDLAYRENLGPGQRPGQQKTQPAKIGAAQNKPPGQTQPANPVPKTEQRFHYIYQAAAYKDKKPCVAFAAKLKAAGYKVRTTKNVENGTTWYRILLDLTGTAEDARVLRAGMQKQGVQKILFRSKKPVR